MEKPKRNDYQEGPEGGLLWLQDMVFYQNHEIEILEYALNLLPTDVAINYVKYAKLNYRKHLK